MATAYPALATTPDAAAERIVVRRKDVPVALWPIIVVLYATLMPREMRFGIGSLEFYSDRIGLLIITPYVIRKIMDGAIRFVLPDFLLIASGIWMIIAMSVHYGLSDGLERGGSLAFDQTMGYLLARISFRSLNDIRKALIIFAPGLFTVAALMMLESLMGRDLVVPVAEAIFGKLSRFVGGVEVGVGGDYDNFRLGLMRARGPFSHAILAGLYLSSLIGIYNLSGIRGWPRILGNAAGLMAFFSISSAAIFAIVISYGLVAYEHLQRRTRELSWNVLIFAGVSFLTLIQIASNSGIIGLLSRMTLNSQTAVYRELTWKFGIISVERNPWFGIGFEEYERVAWMVHNSVDAHWLILAMRFGLFSAVTLFLAVILALIALGKASVHVPRKDSLFYRGLAISLFVMSLAMFTVTLLGAVQNLFTILFGGCVACAQRRNIAFVLQSLEGQTGETP